MATLGQRIKQLRADKGLTQEQLAKELHTSKSRIGMYEIDEREPNKQMMEAIADYFNVDMDYLYGRTDVPNEYQLNNQQALKRADFLSRLDSILPIDTKKFRLLGNIACGEPIFADEDRELYVEAGANIQADFCLRASGDSMIGARIHDGDIVFIRQQDMVEDGEIAAVLIDDEATLKRVYYDREGGVLQLFAENPQYKTMRFVGEELNQIRILGKAVAFQSDLK